MAAEGRRRGRPPGRTIGHGYSMYTHYRCRCQICTAANTRHAKVYQLRKLRENRDVTEGSVRP